MPISESMRQRRKNYLGSSDAAAVLGLDQYRSPADVFYDKTGQIEPSGMDPGSDAIEVGNWCENAVLGWYADKLNVKLTRNQFRVADNKVMAANLDALVQNDPTQAFEAKTTGVTSYYVNDEWGEVGTNEVPERVALQCYHQMAVVPELKVIHIPVLMGGVGFRAYRIDRDEEIIKNLTDAELKFWNDHVLKNVPPIDSVPSLDTLKKLKRQSDKIVTMPNDIISSWIEARAMATEANKIKDDWQKRVLEALGDAEVGESSIGTVTFFERERKGYTVEPSKGRTLYFQKPKKGKNK